MWWYIVPAEEAAAPPGASSDSGSGSGTEDCQVYVPLIGLLVSVFAWGTFAMPMKMEAVVRAELHPAIFQLYISIGIFASSWLVLAVEDFEFTWWGLPATIIWTCGSCFSILAIKSLGMALGQGIWSGFVGLVSFFWGYYGHHLFPDAFHPVHMRSSGLAAGGLVLLILGVGGLAAIGGSGGAEDEAAAVQGHGSIADKKVPFLSEGSVQGKPPSSPPPSRTKFLFGVLMALLTGVFGGSTLVPLKFAHFSGQHSVKIATFLPPVPMEADSPQNSHSLISHSLAAWMDETGDLCCILWPLHCAGHLVLCGCCFPPRRGHRHFHATVSHIYLRAARPSVGCAVERWQYVRVTCFSSTD